MPERRDRRGSATPWPAVSTSRVARELPASQAPRTLIAAASWLPKADSDGLKGNVGAILLSYRRVGGLTQQQLADLLGFDRTYISMIERGRRRITDRGTLRHISRTLDVPPHVLGITGPDDADFSAMLAFGDSVIRLADIARHAGRAAEAASELWPLISLARAGDEHAAVSMLSAALSDAETLRLPHQVQRIIRLTDQPGEFRNQTVRVQAQAALTRLERQLTQATSALRTDVMTNGRYERQDILVGDRGALPRLPGTSGRRHC